MKARSSPVCACLSSVLRSAPAMKIDFFAEVTMTPLIDASFSIASRCSLRFRIVGGSKMFAPDSDRSKVSRQIPSASISRRIIGAVAVIGLILANFFQIPSALPEGRASARRGHAEACPSERLRFVKASVTKLGGAPPLVLLRHRYGRENSPTGNSKLDRRA